MHREYAPARGLWNFLFVLLIFTGLLLPGEVTASSPDDDPSCGGHFQAPCSPPISPACDTLHFELDGFFCVTPLADANPNCGGANQVNCTPPITTRCDTGIAHRVETSTCHHPNPNHVSNNGCGSHTQSACSLPNGGVEWDDEDLAHFTGWPKWSSTTHQQAYYTWLRRAHHGGLQLAVMLAVNNEAMCASGRQLDYPEFDCTQPMLAIDRQIAKAVEFETWLRVQCINARAINLPEVIERSCATPESNRGWFKIVKTPAEARLAISRGQLAVVLGIEEANVFDLPGAFKLAQEDLDALNCDYTDVACYRQWAE